MDKFFIVAIDGTAGSGKSTTAFGAAQKLGWFYLDTGAMYRAITYKVIKDKIDWQDVDQLEKMLATTQIDFNYNPKTQRYHIFLDGEDVTHKIRTPEIDRLVSHIAAIPTVRAKMVKEQQKVATGKNTICEGRDIASVVFPNADLKFYLDCSLEERARRRKKDNQDKVSIQEIRNNLIERDYIDSNREVSPLVRTSDAIYLDTTNLTIEEEIQFVVDMIKLRLLDKKEQANNNLRKNNKGAKNS
ncbi:MAG: (d)CMP kinase [candidate division WOR-3 bacterium]